MFTVSKNILLQTTYSCACPIPHLCTILNASGDATAVWKGLLGARWLPNAPMPVVNGVMQVVMIMHAYVAHAVS